MDPKLATFSLRLKCHWAFRTHKPRQESEIQLRGVPGIRMPAMIANCEESRVWKDMDTKKPTQNTIYWKGTSTFTVDGFKMFHMENFPFDRHIINLEQFQFVWRPDKDMADHYEPMKIVSFTTETCCILPEWKTPPAYIIPIAKYVYTPDRPTEPACASKFIVKLRVERNYKLRLASLIPSTADDTHERVSSSHAAW
jgi:hypothetical protein